MKIFNKVLLASTLALSVTLPAQAEFVLDTFKYKDSSGSIITNYPDSGDVFNTDYFKVNANVSPQNVNDVDLYLENLPLALQAKAEYVFNGPKKSSPFATSGNGELDYASGSTDPASSLTVTYGSLLPLNFYSFGDYLYVDVLYLDPNPANGGMTVKVSASTGANTSTWEKTYTGTLTNEHILVPFTAFTPDATAGTGAGVNWSAVTGSSITFTNPGGAADFTLSEIGVVPAPAAIGILGLGLIGVGLSRRRKQA